MVGVFPPERNQTLPQKSPRVPLTNARTEVRLQRSGWSTLGEPINWSLRCEDLFPPSVSRDQNRLEGLARVAPRHRLQPRNTQVT
jgi:hypothetical protein